MKEEKPDITKDATVKEERAVIDIKRSMEKAEHLKTSENPEKEARNVIEGKEIAFYSAMVEAWIQNRMEMDKAVLALSSGGIGLLVTLLTTVGIQNRWELLPYAFAFIGFAVTIFCCIKIFNKNADYIKNTIKQTPDDTPNLRVLDYSKVTAFAIAVASAIAVGIIAALE